MILHIMHFVNIHYFFYIKTCKKLVKNFYFCQLLLKYYSIFKRSYLNRVLLLLSKISVKLQINFNYIHIYSQTGCH